MDRIKQAQVEERHRQAAQETLQTLLSLQGKGRFAQWIPTFAQVLANAEAQGREEGYQEAVDSVADWYSPEPPDHSWRD